MCDSSTNAFVKKLRNVKFDHFVVNFNSDQRIDDEINNVIDFAKINENLNLINFDYLQMFCVYLNVKMFLFFAIITFSKIDRMRAFVMIIFFKRFMHRTQTNVRKFCNINLTRAARFLT